MRTRHIVMTALLALLVSLANTSCVSLTPEERDITVHTQVTNLLDDCEKLGPVSAESIDPDAAIQKLRKVALTKYPEADSVAVIEVSGTFKERANGIAFKCW